MAQQDFEHFKQEIKDWLDSHPEEYGKSSVSCPLKPSDSAPLC